MTTPRAISSPPTPPLRLPAPPHLCLLHSLPTGAYHSPCPPASIPTPPMRILPKALSPHPHPAPFRLLSCPTPASRPIQHISEPSLLHQLPPPSDSRFTPPPALTSCPSSPASQRGQTQKLPSAPSICLALLSSSTSAGMIAPSSMLLRRSAASRAMQSTKSLDGTAVFCRPRTAMSLEASSGVTQAQTPSPTCARVLSPIRSARRA